MHTARVRLHELAALAMLMLAGSWAVPSSAQTAPTALTLDGPSECPPPATLERAVTELVGHPAELDGVAVTIRRGATGWHARLLTPGGERQLQGESCDAVVEAVALVLALGAAPDVDAPQPEPQSPALTAAAAPSGTPTSSVKVMDAAPVAGGALREPDDGIAIALGGGVLAEAGLLPAPSLGPRLAFDVVWRAWHLDLAMAALLPRRAELGVADAPVADIYWWGAQLAACRRVSAGFAGCFGTELGDPARRGPV